MTAAGARILVVDDDPAIRKIVRDRLARAHDVETAATGAEALERTAELAPHVMLLDLQMPDVDGFAVLERLRDRASPPAVIVITAHGSVEAAVKAMQLGAADFVPKPFESEHLEHVVSRVLETVRLRGRVRHLERELSRHHTLIVGSSPAMARTLALAERAAASDATVLLTGESGSGKEVVARHIHLASRRSKGPFVAVNCASLSAELLESDLFGHERGAFTGAHQPKPGRIEIAAGGTLFLDEIAELAPALQAKLLRVLQEREYERVGGTRAREANVRVIAATHRDLSGALASGQFRHDLFYRLHVVDIRVPSLREHPEDIPALVEHFLRHHARASRRQDLRIDEAASRLLARYAWPGNVRELSNVIERAVVLSEGTTIGVDDLPEDIRDVAPSEPPEDAELGYHEAVRQAKRAIILDALRAFDGHQTQAARRLGLTQPYLARLIKNLDLKRA